MRDGKAMIALQWCIQQEKPMEQHSIDKHALWEEFGEYLTPILYTPTSLFLKSYRSHYFNPMDTQKKKSAKPKPTNQPNPTSLAWAYLLAF